MLLQGSCHCRAVKFCVESVTFYPFMRCYCAGGRCDLVRGPKKTIVAAIQTAKRKIISFELDLST